MQPRTTIRGMSDGISKTLTISTVDGEIVIPERELEDLRRVLNTWQDCGYLPESWICLQGEQ